MTHWGWDNTDEEYSTETDSDTEYFELSSSDSSFDFIENAYSDEEPKKEGELSSSKGAKSEALQRTYSNLSGVCTTTVPTRGVEVSRYPNHSQCLYDTGTDSIKRTSTWNWGNSEDRHESSDSKH